MEIHADCLCKATKVEGIYERDPVKHPDAQMYSQMTFDRFLAERIGVMDSTAVTLCRDNNMPIRVFKMATRGNIKRVVLGETIGTIVDERQRRQPRETLGQGAISPDEDAARGAAHRGAAVVRPIGRSSSAAAGQAHRAPACRAGRAPSRRRRPRWRRRRCRTPW